jgi:hypothetical protein
MRVGFAGLVMLPGVPAPWPRALIDAPDAPDAKTKAMLSMAICGILITWKPNAGLEIDLQKDEHEVSQIGLRIAHLVSSRNYSLFPS